MKEKTLQELFCEKITLEMECYKSDMLQQEPEVILGHAYQIDSTINIYEILLEMSQKIEEEALKDMLIFPNLLAFLYSEWLDYEDSHTEDIWNSLNQSVTGITAVCEKIRGKEEEAA